VVSISQLVSSSLIGTESCVRLVDVNGDDALDVILSMSVPLNSSQFDNMTRDDIKNICQQKGKVSDFFFRRHEYTIYLYLLLIDVVFRRNTTVLVPNNLNSVIMCPTVSCYTSVHYCLH